MHWFLEAFLVATSLNKTIPKTASEAMLAVKKHKKYLLVSRFLLLFSINNNAILGKYFGNAYD